MDAICRDAICTELEGGSKEDRSVDEEDRETMVRNGDEVPQKKKMVIRGEEEEERYL